MQVQIQQLAPGMIQQIQTVCSECRGQREIIDPKDRCKVCQVNESSGNEIVSSREERSSLIVILSMTNTNKQYVCIGISNNTD